MSSRLKRNNGEINIITPEMQYGNLKGVLNNNINNGSLNPNNPENSLGNLYDVNLNDLKKDDVLVYNGISWINKNYADIAKNYIWDLDGGSANGFNEDNSGNNPDPDNPNPDNPDKPVTNYAEQTLVILNNFINGETFQESAKGIKGIKDISMENNNIYMKVNGRVDKLLEMFYNNDEINSMMGRVINVVYDNVGYGLRNAFDEVSNDVNDCILDWKVNGCGVSGENIIWENKVFIFMSDSSGLFLGIRVKME